MVGNLEVESATARFSGLGDTNGASSARSGALGWSSRSSVLRRKLNLVLS